MPKYSSAWFNVPAPMAYVQLRNGETGITWEDVPMLIDTGAEWTLIPQQALEQLGLSTEPERRFELAGFDGSTSTAELVRVELIFLQRTFRGEFLLVEGEYGILGRNILNVVPLMFDGPRLIWDEVHQGR